MILTYLLLQAAQAAQQPVFITPSGSIDNGPNIWFILCAIGGVIVAIGGLIGWAIRSTLPSLIDDFRKRTDSLTKVAESVPVAIKEIGTLVIEVKNDMKLSLSNTEERVISAIQDQKLKDLSDQIADHDRKLKDLSPK